MASPNFRDQDPLVGYTIADKYRIDAAIARGGMGRVYRATQLALEREVAVKVLDLGDLMDRGSSDEVIDDFRRRFVLEAASAAKLTHPNTIVIHDYGAEGEALLYMVMELLDGETLMQRLDRTGVLPAETAVRIMVQVSGSLAEAHERGLVHRDLKPSNIMLVQRGPEQDFAKVLDFGLVKQDDDHGLTQSGALIGTPRYMSPEQVGGADVTPASDIYSLGACLYHALTGQPPFESDSKYVLMAAHMNVLPSPFREVAPEVSVPPELEAVVMRCLQKDPLERFASMDDVSEAMIMAMGDDFSISGAMHSRPRSGAVPLKGTTSQEMSANIVDTQASLPTASMPTDTAPKNRGVLAALFLMAALVTGGVLYRSLRPSPSADEVVPPPDQLAAQGTPQSVGAAENGRPVETLEVIVRSDPAGARVIHGTEDRGNTPARIPLAAGSEADVRLEMDGFEPRTIHILAEQRFANVVMEPQTSATDSAGVAPSDPDAQQESGNTEPAESSDGEEAVTSGRSTRRISRRGRSRSTSTTPTETSGGTGTSSTSTSMRTDNRDPWANE